MNNISPQDGVQEYYQLFVDSILVLIIRIYYHSIQSKSVDHVIFLWCVKKQKIYN